jgi:hydroxyacylglutathione hydrolase
MRGEQENQVTFTDVSMNGQSADPQGPGPRVVVLRMQYLTMTNYNYLVVDPTTRQAVIVDPAWEMHKVERALAQTQSVLAGILVTHSHPDHIHLARPLAARYRCPIWMSKAEISLSGFDAAGLVGIDAVPWYVGAMQIQPLFTPGHTPGCVCYLIGDNLFTGDVLFAEGCGMCPDVAAAHTMFSSLEYLKALIEPHTRVFPGHSYGKPPGQSFAQLLRDNIYLQFSDKESFAAFRLRKVRKMTNVFGL